MERTNFALLKQMATTALRRRRRRTSFSSRSRLDPAGEGALGALVVPLGDPRVRAQVGEAVLKVLAHVGALALHLFAAVKVQIALVAVLGLVRVREPRIERGRLQGERRVGHTES